MCQFSGKNGQLWLFWSKFAQKIDLGLEIQKTNVGIKISILEISCVEIFRQNGQLWLFRHKFAQKWILGSEFQKSKCRFRERAPQRDHVCQFSVKMDNFECFGLNLGKLLNYVWYFGSNNVEGVTESWVEAEMSWVEVGAWLSNTLFFNLKKKYFDLKISRFLYFCEIHRF